MKSSSAFSRTCLAIVLALAPVAAAAGGAFSGTAHADDGDVITVVEATTTTTANTNATSPATMSDAAPTPASPPTLVAATVATTAPTASGTTAAPTSRAVGTPAAGIEVLRLGAGATRAAVRLTHSGSILFPLQVVKGCAVLDNYADARSGGRVHEGEDIASPLGTPIYAVVDGTLNRQVVNGAASSALSGNAWYLTDPTDKTYYFYAHLSAFKDGLVVGATVHQGDVIGYVGDTGNPGPGNYHLHFEVHPKGGAAVDPLPMLTVPFGCAVY
jgi:murein DD-endopeptidase MepM/ murein hydrolase activator NlpD